ncbi:hypothetical protein HOD08_03205 [bacterium]|jgi:hypothetical protein|nr:hypothetical protein [bacterium]
MKFAKIILSATLIASNVQIHPGSYLSKEEPPVQKYTVTLKRTKKYNIVWMDPITKMLTDAMSKLNPPPRKILVVRQIDGALSCAGEISSIPADCSEQILSGQYVFSPDRYDFLNLFTPLNSQDRISQSASLDEKIETEIDGDKKVALVYAGTKDTRLVYGQQQEIFCTCAAYLESRNRKGPLRPPPLQIENIDHIPRKSKSNRPPNKKHRR